MHIWHTEMRELAQCNRWIVVGISGVTNSGKTTLARQLETVLPNAVLIKQDEYFRQEDDPSHVWVELSPKGRHQNWERLECVKWEAMCDKIREVLSMPTLANQVSFLLLDGHIIFNYWPIERLCDEKFFIDLDKQTVYSRRIHRNYIPRDPEGYFEQIVWPMYNTNRKKLNEKNIIFINGSQTKEAIFQEVYGRLRRHIALIGQN